MKPPHNARRPNSESRMAPGWRLEQISIGRMNYVRYGELSKVNLDGSPKRSSRRSGGFTFRYPCISVSTTGLPTSTRPRSVCGNSAPGGCRWPLPWRLRLNVACWAQVLVQSEKQELPRNADADSEAECQAIQRMAESKRWDSRPDVVVRSELHL